MGAGIFPAGTGGFGRDPVQSPSAPTGIAAPPRALRFDPVARTFVDNPDGTLADVDPIDQQVALSLFIEAGSVRSNPTQGNNLRKRLNRIDPKRAQSIVEDEVKLSLKSLIDNKDILLVSATVDQSVRGRSLISVSYFNLRDPAFAQKNKAELKPTVISGALAS